MGSPNNSHNNTMRVCAGLIFACSIGCVQDVGAIGDSTDAETDGATETEWPGDGDGDPTGDGEGEGELLTECDDTGRCWARRGWWGAWAQAADIDDIEAGVESGTLTPAPDLGTASCWWYATDARTCVVMSDGVLLIGRPLEELSITALGCAPSGPWSDSAEETFWCRGIFGSVGVALKLD